MQRPTIRVVQDPEHPNEARIYYNDVPLYNVYKVVSESSVGNPTYVTIRFKNVEIQWKKPSSNDGVHRWQSEKTGNNLVMVYAAERCVGCGMHRRKLHPSDEWEYLVTEMGAWLEMHEPECKGTVR